MKYSVLTCIFNNYEVLRTPYNPNPDVEYVCVTDNPELKDDVWQIKYLNDIQKLMPENNQWTYVRYHPFEFVSNDICLYVDGSIQLKADFTKFLIYPFVFNDFEYGVMAHLMNQTIQDDVETWRTTRGISNSESDNALRLIKDTNYDVKGYIQSGCLLYRKGKVADIINNATWDLCYKLSDTPGTVYRNNQLALTYVINKMFYMDERIMIMSPLCLNSDYLQIYFHNDRHTAWDIDWDPDYPNGELVFFDHMVTPHVNRNKKPDWI